jgi:hypothetical protein
MTSNEVSDKGTHLRQQCHGTERQMRPPAPPLLGPAFCVVHSSINISFLVTTVESVNCLFLNLTTLSRLQMLYSSQNISVRGATGSDEPIYVRN